MRYKNHDILGDFQYVYNTHNDTVNENTVFANIIKETDTFVYIKRFHNFGNTQLKDSRITKTEFEKQFKKLPTETEKLIQILTPIENMDCVKHTDCMLCKYSHSTNCKIKAKADYLIKHGVTVDRG